MKSMEKMFMVAAAAGVYVAALQPIHAQDNTNSAKAATDSPKEAVDPAVDRLASVFVQFIRSVNTSHRVVDAWTYAKVGDVAGLTEPPPSAIVATQESDVKNGTVTVLVTYYVSRLKIGSYSKDTLWFAMNIPLDALGKAGFGIIDPGKKGLKALYDNKRMNAKGPQALEKARVSEQTIIAAGKLAHQRYQDNEQEKRKRFQKALKRAERDQRRLP